MKNYKIQNIFYVFIGAVDILLLLMLLLFITYTIMQNTQRHLGFIEEEEKKINLSLCSALDTTKSTAVSALQSMNYLVFSNCSEEEKLNRYAARVNATLRSELFQHSDVDGFFLFNSACETFYPCYRGTSFARLKEDIFEIHRNALEADLTNQWFASPVDGVPYVFYLMHRRYGSVLLMVNLRKNSGYLQSRELLNPGEDTIFDFFLGIPEFPRGIISISAPAGQIDGLFVVYAARKKTLPEIFDITQLILFSVMFLLFALVQVVFLLLQHLTYKPIREIARPLEKITAGDFDCRIKIRTDIHEIAKLSEAINKMLDRIDLYKTDSFNLRMDAVQAKLQYLQLQIRPHFYKNCLKNVYSLINLTEYEKAGQTVLSLSDYMEYVFRDVKNFIPLREELSAVQSYVDLCNIMRNDIELTFSLDAGCFMCNVLPMSVLTFVENSLKHRSILDILHIDIQADIYFSESSGRKMLRIVIEDDGGGFPEEVLISLGQADVTQLTYQHRQIGISNVRYRLWLIYGRDAAVNFKNREHHAVVTITLPWEINSRHTAPQDILMLK